MAHSILLLILIISVFSGASCIEEKCAACNAVARELELELSREKPKNHLDMRHRLDSKGQRQGKVIDYRVSELRAVDLLDGLCEKMKDYTLEKIDSTKQVWIKVPNWDILPTSKQEAKAYANDIATYCGRLLEQTEDEFTELIKQGAVKVGDVCKVLCQDLSNHCSNTSDETSSDSDDDDEDEDEAEL